MKIYKISSLIHQFYKELKVSYKRGQSVLVPFKYLFSYIRQNRIKQDRLQNKVPWMTIPALKLLESYEVLGANIFEYGSGASTLYFANRGANITSIEHDSLWYALLKNRLEKESFNNVSLILKEPEKSISPNGIYSSKDERFLGCDYAEYVQSIAGFDDKYFDIVVVDGRVRVACLEAALSKLKIGGLLVFDNGNREEYQEALSEINSFLILSEYTVTVFDLYFSQTNIYIIG